MTHSRALFMLVVSLALLLQAGAAAGDRSPSAEDQSGQPVITVSSAPGNGMTTFATDRLSAAQLAGLPQTSDTVTIDGASTTESGPLVSAVLGAAGLNYIAGCKNDELRYWIEASGGAGSVVVTAGEIDPGFGQNPAILSMSENGTPLARPRLVLPTDLTDARDLQDIDTLIVGRAAPQLAGGTGTPSQTCTPTGFQPPIDTPAKGTVVVNGDVAHQLSLTYSQLGGLPQVDQTDTYFTKSSNTVSEVGPSLYDIVSMAEPQFRGCSPSDDLDFYVEITSSEDGYATLVSWAEIDPFYNAQTAALSPLMSLTENGTSTLSTDTDPRFTAPRDHFGGRYVYGAAVITVFRVPGGPEGRGGCGRDPFRPLAR